jgi:RNA polymerase sigma factor (sigma-70 family)
MMWRSRERVSGRGARVAQRVDERPGKRSSSMCPIPTDATDDDRALLARTSAGDREALTALYTRHRSAVFAYLLRLTPDQHLAEDLLQETFVAVWKSAASFAGRSTVKTWLIGIAHRQAHNVLRRRSEPLVDEAELAALVAADPEPEDAALAHATRAELLAAIAQLSLAHRETLALAFGQEMPAAEIAEALGIPIGTVRSRLRDAKRLLRAALRDTLGAEREDRR